MERKRDEGESSGTIAVIPMKPLADSKTRLSRKFSTEERGALSLGLLSQVITALRAASVDVFWVVGGDDKVRNLTLGAEGVWMEELGRNLNDTVAIAFDRVFERGKGALYVASDLPFLKAGDIHSILQATRKQNNISLAPARRDGGTNAILVPPAVQFKPELGPRSFLKHLSQAANIGVSVAICYSPGLGFDLDTLDDLEAYEHMEPGLLDRLLRGQATASPNDE